MTKTFNQHTNYKQSQKGTVVIETALCITTLILFIVSAIDFGLIFIISNSLNDVARQGARLGIVIPNLKEDDPRITIPLQTFLQNLGIKTAVVHVNLNTTMIPGQRVVIVTAQVQFSPIAPLTAGFFSNPFFITGRSSAIF